MPPALQNDHDINYRICTMKTIFLLVKFFKKQEYANAFVNGKLRANKLPVFKDSQNNDDSGRIDPYEGTTSWLQPSKIQLVINGRNMTNDLAGPTQIQLNWLNEFHIVCLHAVHTGNLDEQNLSNDNIEDLRRELRISDECFTLGDHAVVVFNVPEFIRRMTDAAKAKNYQMARKLVKYFDPETAHFDFHDGESIFWKQDHLSHQREFRFAFYTGLNDEFLCLDIGDLSDITWELKSTELNGEKLLGGELQLGSSVS